MIIKYKGKRYRPRWGRIVIALFLLAGVIDLLFIAPDQVHDTPHGQYVCKGGLIKVCGTDSQAVYDYVNP